MKKTKPILLILASLLLAASVGAATFTGANVGTPGLAGSVTGTAPGVQTIVGGGNDIWGGSDNFYYVYASITGQVWDAKVRVQDLQGPDWWSKCELMARVPGAATPQGPDPFVAMMTTRTAGENRIAPQYRASRGAGAGDAVVYTDPAARPAYPNAWLRLTRQGSLFTFYYGTDGTTWTKHSEINTATAQNGFGTPFPDPLFVGAAVTAHNDGDLVGGVATISDLSVTVTPSTPSLVMLTNPQDSTNYAGSDVFLSCLATNTALANSPVGSYQWYKNGVLIPNAVNSKYAFLVGASENGAKFYCRAAMAGATTLNSSTGTVTVLAATEYPGYVKYQAWPGGNRTALNNGNYGAPTRVSGVPAFDAPADWGDWFGARLSGIFTAPANGDYVFFVCADDDADLFLSTDAEPANKRLIAQQEGWAGRNNWASHGGGGSTLAVTQRRSDNWTPDGGVTYPYGSGIHLVAGQKYFIMATHTEGNGGDNVEAYFKLNTESDPVDGLPSNLTNGAITMLTRPATTLTITTQPQDYSTFEGLNASFTVAVTTDAELTPVYQWQRNQVNMGGRTSPTLAFSPASIADNGAKYRCIITLLPTSLSVTSAEVTLTVNASAFITGIIRQEIWGYGTNDQSRDNIINGVAGTPSVSRFIAMFDQPDFADYYGQRLSTWFKPPQNGNYVFFLCSDDDSDLFLSTNDDPVNKRLIARQTQWNGTRDWNGGTDLTQRRSDMFTPDGGVTTPGAGGIALQASQTYYLEAVMHEGNGGDNLAAYYALYSDTVAPPANNTESNIRGDRVGMKLPAAKTLEITSEPADQTVGVFLPATFSIAITSDALYPANYQWRRGGANIAGATTTQYSFNTVQADDQAKFVCVVSFSQSSVAKTSRVATLTVSADIAPPQVLGAGALAKSDGTTIELGVEFNERLDHATAIVPGNYPLSKGTVTGVRHYTWVGNTSFDAVALEVTGLVNGDTVNLTVQNVKDVSLNTIATVAKSVTVNTAIRYAVVGGRELFTTPPAGTTAANWPDDAIALGNGGFLTLSACNGHWDNYDEQTFVYEALTGNFERVVRLQSQDDSSNWGRAGLMAREELLEGVDRGTMGAVASRNLNIRANPTRQWNGSGANNTIESVRREATGGNYVDAGGTGAVPAYPNQWLKIRRVANLLSCQHSSNGTSWTDRGSMTATPDWLNSLFVGLFYAPEMNNNSTAAGVGHSTKAIFRSLGAEVVLPVVPPTIKITKSGNNVVISWTPAGGHLESRAAVGAGTWNNEGTANPAIEAISGEMYFRVVVP